LLFIIEFRGNKRWRQPNANINGTENDPKIQKDITEDEDIVNPWEVKAESITGVDYDKIIGKLNELMVEIIMTNKPCSQMSSFLLSYTL